MKSHIRKFDPFAKRMLDPPQRYCDHPGCHSAGDHKAPRTRKLDDFYWFCANHAREYNRAWNYYAGMSEAEIEAHIRIDTCWQRPTWPLGARMAGFRGFESVKDKDRFGIFDDEPAGVERPPHERPERIKAPEVKAMATLGLEGLLTPDVLKARYKELVKQHHPDMHGGDKTFEEKFKAINDAYSILKKYLEEHP
ncbi:MAG: hypothetical protein A2516_08985 [Alphaproteobacteria bacterium RIFOXYD12_FULL_60_8]|nr:MAG: hypothetical protein A2516_08985 [Alphaproteobacteria bacterium RIFOXYD12_FULL_60_8]